VQIEVSSTIKRPVGEVFAVLGDPANTPRWTSGMQTVTKTSDGPIGVGTTYHSTAKILGRRLEGDAEITAFEADRRIAVRGAVPFPVTISYALEPVADGTRVVQTIHAEPGGFFKLAQPILPTMLKRQGQGDLDTLRDLMEADAL